MIEWMRDSIVVSDLKSDFASKTINDCYEFIETAQDTSESVHFAIMNDMDEYMGTVNLKHIRDLAAEFGISVRSYAMGKGYSKFAMTQTINFRFKDVNLKKIYWCVDPANMRALCFYDKNEYTRITSDEIVIREGIAQKIFQNTFGIRWSEHKSNYFLQLRDNVMRRK